MTDHNPWSISFLNGYYDIVQPTNSLLRIDVSNSDLRIETHPTQLTEFYINDVLFDQRQCTSPASTGRDDLITKILNLNTGGGGPAANVNIVSPIPLPVSVVASVPIAISNFPAVQPVSGTVTALQGTSPWVTSVSNFPAIQDVNEAQIGGSAYTLGQKTMANSAPIAIASDQSAVPVTGTVTANQGTSPWVTSVSNFPAIQPVSGTVTALQGTSPWVTSGTSTVTGPVTVNQGTSPWVTSVSNFPATVAVTQSTSPWVVNETQIGGSAYTLGQKTMANSAPVVLASDESPITANQGTSPWVTSGTATVTGTVTANQGTSPWVSSVTNFPAIQPVSGTVAVSNFPATQPVSGTVTANQGTSPWVVNETQIGGSAYTLGQKTMANSAPVVIASDQSAVTVNQGTSPWVTSGTSTVTGTVTANQGTSPWVTSVSNFPATQPVSGTVTALQGTSPWVVNETQIGGSSYTLGQKTSANSAPVVIASDQSAIPISGTISTAPSIPATADIVGASRNTTGTLVTIPANRTFLGSLSLSCALSLIGANNPTISAAGAGVVPTGTLHQIIANGLALSVVANSNTISNVFIFGGSAGATVTFTAGAAGASTGQIAGRLL